MVGGTVLLAASSSFSPSLEALVYLWRPVELPLFINIGDTLLRILFSKIIDHRLLAN